MNRPRPGEWPPRNIDQHPSYSPRMRTPYRDEQAWRRDTDRAMKAFGAWFIFCLVVFMGTLGFVGWLAWTLVQGLTAP